MRTQIILAGIGGQGILFATRILSELGLNMGLGVMGSETHGMSQRGGSVITHLKLGDFHSPMIRTGQADILYAFDINEAYRALKFLKTGGICFLNLKSVDRFEKKILSHLEAKEIKFQAFDASDTAGKIGSVMSTNLVLLGYSVGTGLVPFIQKDFKNVLASVGGKKNAALNLEAFDTGFRAGKNLPIPEKNRCPDT